MAKSKAHAERQAGTKIRGDQGNAPVRPPSRGFRRKDCQLHFPDNYPIGPA